MCARASSCSRFVDYTQLHTTVGKTPLDKGLACHRDLYLSTQQLQETNPYPDYLLKYEKGTMAITTMWLLVVIDHRPNCLLLLLSPPPPPLLLLLDFFLQEFIAL
jgi:hypothetical protein